jgi:hypothetical protein
MDPDPEDESIDPIKVKWTGYARGRISEYNGQYQEEEQGVLSPIRFLKCVNRQKTNVVIETVEEASAVYYELASYDSGQRTWMNGMMDKAIRRVRSEIRDEMEERGYEAVYDQDAGRLPLFKGFED